MKLNPGKKIYFASDFHLGIPDYARSLEREKKVVRWLCEIEKDAAVIFLMGDLFDFWFEYKTVVPKGFTRLLGKIAELTDKGISVQLFTGNHDMWIFDYLPHETGVHLHRNPITVHYNDKRFYLGHGDGLGPGDEGYKFIKKVFASPLCQWLFARIHPNLGIGLAHYWSRKSRLANGINDAAFLGEDKEWLVIYCKVQLKKEHADYFIFGHRHLPLDIKVGENSRYINLGDWYSYFSYAEFDGKEVTLKYIQ